MTIRVAKRRVRRNLLIWLALSIAALLLGSPGVAGPWMPLAAALAGWAYGSLHWRRLRTRIARSGDAVAPNRVFVRFLSVGEALLTAAAWSLPLLAFVALLGTALTAANAALGGLLLASFGAFGTTASLTAGAALVRYERRQGPLYYQYASEFWGGGESLLFCRGVALEALAPEGWVRVEGERWRARSADGRALPAGSSVEVVDRDGFCLLVTAPFDDGTAHRDG